ncbi:MAG: DUF1003 domain-containing protein [Verrucomicrobiota bacterium]
MKHRHTGICQISKKECHLDDLVPGNAIRPKIVRMIRHEHPDWNNEGYISTEILNQYRMRYVQQLLEADIGELSVIENEVIGSIKDHEILVENLNKDFDQSQTFGERLSDGIASFGGSWKFIILFGSLLVLWILLNTFIIRHDQPDPYPYILLNLILSCIAAFQAPFIMMSQNRAAQKDRLHAENDYKINLKAELEIRHIQEKMDHLLKHQSLYMSEVQQIQLDLLQQISNVKGK